MKENTAMHGTELLHRVCPLCDYDNNAEEVLIRNFSWNLKKCAQCGFVYIEDVPLYEALQESFSWQQSWRREKERRQQEEKALHKVQDILRSTIKKFKRDKLTDFVHGYIKKGNVLYVGCGVGHRVKHWSTEIIPFGIEIEPEAAAKSDVLFSKRGGRVVCAPGLDGVDEFDDGFFEGVVMYAYLEHESKPVEVLKKTKDKMKQMAKLIIKVPNYGCINRRFRGMKWCGYRFPDHVNYFTPDTLQKVLNAAGYDIEKFGFLDHLPTSDNMWMVTSPCN